MPEILIDSVVALECVKCGYVNTRENIVDRLGETKCFGCGYRVLKKQKPPIVKRVKAI